ncbi:MAG: acyltransferase [Candidatus Lokiarchaeota archaeon]|nr:acyltransferase [Candidatus Lokiarchaeota archaeon]
MEDKKKYITKNYNERLETNPNKEQNDNSSVGKKFFQIDVMKTICIIQVIAVHTISNFFPLGSLWQIIQPVPLFFIILGFNYGNSFKKKDWHKLGDMYSFQYFKGMFWRLIFPLLLINLICFLIDIIVFTSSGFHINGWSSTQLSTVSWGETNVGYNAMNIFYFLIGTPYFPGPGEFYVVILMQFILIFPLIYKLFDKSPVLGLISCYIIELSFQLIAGNPEFTFFDEYTFLFCGNILRYMSVIGLGVWFVNNYNLFKKKNIFIIILAIPALFLLILVYWGELFFPNFLNNPIIDNIFKPTGSGYGLEHFRTYPWWEKANLFTYFFPALIFLMFMKFLPSELNQEKPRSRSISKFFKKYSKLTYHILLVQIVYFFISVPIFYGVSIGINSGFYEIFIDPIVEPYGITESYQFDYALLSLKASALIFSINLFLIFLNCAVTFTLAIWFRNIDSNIQKNLKKIGLKINKSKIKK